MPTMKTQRDMSPEANGSILVANPLPSPRRSNSPVTSTSSSTPPEDHNNHHNSATTNAKGPFPPRRRGTVACRRCRRLRTKCVHGSDCQVPCEACRASGPQAAAECSFPRRGDKDVDRDFRRRPTATNPGLTTSANAGAQRLSVSSASSSASRRGSLSLHHPHRRHGSVSLAPPVQPLPDGLHLLVDAPMTGSTNRRIQDHGPQSSNSSSTSTASSSPPPQRKLPNVPPHISLSRRHYGAAPSLPIAGSSKSGPLFPPHKEIVAGCRVFVSSYFQLGFLPKAIFLEAITRNVHAVSPFLLSSILSIAARFTPSLVRRYGSAARATENFLQISRTLAPTEMYHPSLERTQGFFLLAIAEWGHGDKERSAMDMGVAVRMASILKLHREETYASCMGPTATPEQVIRAESARRTFWLIHSQENLQAGYSAPAPFPPEDITARLPCDEHSFAFGVNPAPRAVLAGSVPAQQRPDAARSPHRCLFATMIQAHHLWGQVARRACRADLKAATANTTATAPWDAGSEYQLLTKELRTFESEMPERHRWSVWNLRVWQDEDLHLSYLAIVMVLRVANIVERRIYLDEILLSVNNQASADHGDEMLISPRTTPVKQAPDGFWTSMANELFENVLELYEQIDAFFTLRTTPEEGFPAIVVFCVYICGSLASYLWRYPQLCPHVATRAEEMSLRCVQVLEDLHKAWPTSTRWNQGLQQIAGPLAAASAAAAVAAAAASSYGSCSSSGDSPLSSIASAGSLLFPGTRSGLLATTTQEQDVGDLAIDPRLAGCSQIKPETYSSSSSGSNNNNNGTAAFSWKGGSENEEPDPEAFPNELFEAEMSTLLAGDADFGWLDFERGGN